MLKKLWEIKKEERGLVAQAKSQEEDLELSTAKIRRSFKVFLLRFQFFWTWLLPLVPFLGRRSPVRLIIRNIYFKFQHNSRTTKETSIFVNYKNWKESFQNFKQIAKSWGNFFLLGDFYNILPTHLYPRWHVIFRLTLRKFRGMSGLICRPKKGVTGTVRQEIKARMWWLTRCKFVNKGYTGAATTLRWRWNHPERWARGNGYDQKPFSPDPN